MAPTATPRAVARSAEAERIVTRLDELAALTAADDVAQIAQWLDEEDAWVLANLTSLLDQGSPLDAYFNHVLDLEINQHALPTPRAEAINVLLADRKRIASAYGLEIAELPTPTKAPGNVVTEPVLVSYEDEVFRGVAGAYHWSDVDVQEKRFRVRWSVYAPSERSCKFKAWFDSHPETTFVASPKAGKRTSGDKGVSAVTQGGLRVRTNCAKWVLRVVAPTYADNSYWYCWDSGAPRPHHLGYPVPNDHWCTDEELRQSGF